MKWPILISVLLLTACTETVQVNKQDLIYKALEQKYSAFQQQQLEECRYNAIIEADIYVDSIIYQRQLFSILEDSVQMISKPIRPERPNYIKITDPGPIKPFEAEKTR